MPGGCRCRCCPGSRAPSIDSLDPESHPRGTRIQQHTRTHRTPYTVLSTPYTVHRCPSRSSGFRERVATNSFNHKQLHAFLIIMRTFRFASLCAGAKVKSNVCKMLRVKLVKIFIKYLKGGGKKKKLKPYYNLNS